MKFFILISKVKKNLRKKSVVATICRLRSAEIALLIEILRFAQYDIQIRLPLEGAVTK